MDNISPFVRPGPDGKPIFFGKDEPAQQAAKVEGTKITCPVCNQEFDYLVGEDTPDGGRKGCETCWRPSPGKKYAQDIPGADEAQKTILD